MPVIVVVDLIEMLVMRSRYGEMYTFGNGVKDGHLLQFCLLWDFSFWLMVDIGLYGSVLTTCIYTIKRRDFVNNIVEVHTFRHQ